MIGYRRPEQDVTMDIISNMTQMEKDGPAVNVNEKKPQIDQNNTENTEVSTTPNASLHKALARMSSNGSSCRTITPNRPTIYTRITDPKNGNGSHMIKGIFAGKKDYHYNDHLTAAFVELAELGRKAKLPLIAVTCTFNDATHKELKEADTKDEARSMVRKFKRALTGEVCDRTKPGYWNVDSILVIEECDQSTVEMPSGNEEKRLHLHMLTYANSNEQKRLEAILKPFSMQTRIQDTWTNKRPYTVLDAIEEDQFGDIPTDAPDPANNHWLNTYKTAEAPAPTDKNKEPVQWVHTRYPVCLRGADYITKGLNNQIGDGRNFTLIGLKNAPKRRLELFKQGKALGKPKRDWS